MPRRRRSEGVEEKVLEEVKKRYPSGLTRTRVAEVFNRSYWWARYHLEKLAEEKRVERFVRFVDRVRRVIYVFRPEKIEMREITAYLKYEAGTAGASKRYEYKVASWVEDWGWRGYENVLKMLWRNIWHFIPDEGLKFSEAEPEFGRTNREVAVEDSYEVKQWIYAVRLHPEGTLERCGEAKFVDIVSPNPDAGYGNVRDKGSGWLKSREEVRRYSWNYLGGPPYR